MRLLTYKAAWLVDNYRKSGRQMSGSEFKRRVQGSQRYQGWSRSSLDLLVQRAQAMLREDVF